MLDEERFQGSGDGKISQKTVELELSLKGWLGACQVEMMQEQNQEMGKRIVILGQPDDEYEL